MIKRYVHGDAKTDSKLFAAVGAMALNPKIHTELGNAITSINGDVWYLWFDEMNKLFGFCQTRKLKNGKLHIRFLYAEGLGMKIKNELIGWVLTDARTDEVTEIYTNDRNNAGMWGLLGFKADETKSRGAFVRWEKLL